MSTIKLSDLKKAAEQKYGDFEVVVPAAAGEKKTRTAKFRPVLRCDKATRAAYAKATDPMNHLPEGTDATEVDEDIVDVLLAAVKAGFLVVAYSQHDFELLDEALGDDLAFWQELFVEYNKDGGLTGEA